MPIYEYKCKDCDNDFEVMQKASDAPLEKCEKCGGALEKQWSLSGFQFKGGGWYKTDYAAGAVGGPNAPKVDVAPNEKMVATNLLPELKDKKSSSAEPTTPARPEASNPKPKKDK